MARHITRSLECFAILFISLTIRHVVLGDINDDINTNQHLTDVTGATQPDSKTIQRIPRPDDEYRTTSKAAGFTKPHPTNDSESNDVTTRSPNDVTTRSPNDVTTRSPNDVPLPSKRSRHQRSTDADNAGKMATTSEVPRSNHVVDDEAEQEVALEVRAGSEVNYTTTGSRRARNLEVGDGGVSHAGSRSGESEVATKATFRPGTSSAADENQLPVLLNVGDRKHAPANSALQDPYAWISLNVSLSIEGDTIHVDWNFTTNETRVTGFVVCYRVQDREEYDSSKLELGVRHFTLHSLHKDQIYEICVHVMINTTVIREECHPWSQDSMKMVVGIMAGTIFLIPCIILMIWILFKDKAIRKKYAFLFVKDKDLEALVPVMTNTTKQETQGRPHHHNHGNHPHGNHQHSSHQHHDDHHLDDHHHGDHQHGEHQHGDHHHGDHPHHSDRNHPSDQGVPAALPHQPSPLTSGLDNPLSDGARPRHPSDNTTDVSPTSGIIDSGDRVRDQFTAQDTDTQDNGPGKSDKDPDRESKV